MVNE
jgi:predicted PilT family ATPase